MFLSFSHLILVPCNLFFILIFVVAHCFCLPLRPRYRVPCFTSLVPFLALVPLLIFLFESADIPLLSLSKRYWCCSFNSSYLMQMVLRCYWSSTFFVWVHPDRLGHGFNFFHFSYCGNTVVLLQVLRGLVPSWERTAKSSFANLSTVYVRNTRRVEHLLVSENVKRCL